MRKSRKEACFIEAAVFKLASHCGHISLVENKEGPIWRRNEVVDWNMRERVDGKWRGFYLISCKENHRLIMQYTLCNREWHRMGLGLPTSFKILVILIVTIISEVAWLFGSPPQHLHITHFNCLTQWTPCQLSSVTWFDFSEGPLLMFPFSPISLHCACSLILKVTEWSPALLCRLDCIAACSLP